MCTAARRGGYMTEYAVGRSFIGSRIATILGGTTGIMKEDIGRDIASGVG
jgi:alkylation response protein AidB-like acyl-CoA dehydrogenase